jgi:hypothetical protein
MTQQRFLMHVREWKEGYCIYPTTGKRAASPKGFSGSAMRSLCVGLHFLVSATSLNIQILDLVGLGASGILIVRRVRQFGFSLFERAC